MERKKSCNLIFVSALNEEAQLVSLWSPNGFWHATISLRGASLLQLEFQNNPIVITPDVSHFKPFAGAVLAPWANRLQDGVWDYNGKTLFAPVNDIEGNNAIHGLVADAVFTFEPTTSKHTVRLTTTLNSSEAYEPSLAFDVGFELTDQGLVSTIEIKNLHDLPAPVCLGVHPYLFVAYGSQLEVNAASEVLVNDRKLPIGTIQSRLSQSELIEKLELDTCFFDFTDSSKLDDAKHATVITRPDLGVRVSVWQSSEFQFAMIFVADRVANSPSGKAIAIEPQTGPANALASKDGLTWLEPGQDFSAKWGIGLQMKETK